MLEDSDSGSPTKDLIKHFFFFDWFDISSIRLNTCLIIFCGSHFGVQISSMKKVRCYCHCVVFMSTEADLGG